MKSSWWMFERQMMGAAMDLFEPWIFAGFEAITFCKNFQPHFPPARWGNRRVIGDKTVGNQLAHMPTDHSKAHIFHILWLHLSLSLSLYVPIFVIKMLQLVIWCQTVAARQVLKQLTHASAQALNQLAWQGRLERCHGAFGSASSGEKPL